MAEGGTVVCSDCGLSEMVVSGPLMFGVEVTACVCRSCRRFVTLEHDWALDEPRPALVCPDCVGPVEAIEFAGTQVVMHRLTDWRNSEPAPLEEATAVGCPACGGELHVEDILRVD